MEFFAKIIYGAKSVQIRSYFWSVFSCIRTESKRSNHNFRRKNIEENCKFLKGSFVVLYIVTKAICIFTGKYVIMYFVRMQYVFRVLLITLILTIISSCSPHKTDHSWHKTLMLWGDARSPLTDVSMLEALSQVLICHLADHCQVLDKNRSSRLEALLRKGVPKICSKFAGQHPCRSFISIKLQSKIKQDQET